ncbi:MAG: hypothetical protein U0798_18125 [Gemmataceae bacterium]
MFQILDTNLIRLFDFYLLLMFVIGLLRRFALYRDVVILTIATFIRQPNLVKRLSANRDVLMDGKTLRPIFFALLLMSIQLVMSRLIWPSATITIHEVSQTWWQAALLVVLFIPMVSVDVYFLARVGQIDRHEAKKHLARAEHWLSSWQGTAVKLVTFGYVNPRQMVDDQLRENLTWFRGTIQWSMWWVVVQVGLRVMWGVAIWLLWAFRNRPETV